MAPVLQAKTKRGRRARAGSNRRAAPSPPARRWHRESRSRQRSAGSAPVHANVSSRRVWKSLILELPRALVGAENFRLHLLQLGRDEALAADGRLLACVMRRHAGEIRFRDLDEIAEDRVETHLERLDPGARDLALLQFGDPVFPSREALRSSSRSASKPSRKIPPSLSANGGSSTRARPNFAASSGISRSSLCRRAASDSVPGDSCRAICAKREPSEERLQLSFQLWDLLEGNFVRRPGHARFRTPGSAARRRARCRGSFATMSRSDASRSGSCSRSAIICWRPTSSASSRSGCKIQVRNFPPTHRRDRPVERREQARVARAARSDQFEVGLGGEHRARRDRPKCRNAGTVR